MSELVVVDTSVFIDYLRGSADDLLALLILKNRVLLSPTVRLELLSGVRKTELKTLERLLNSLRHIDDFPTPMACEQLLTKARGSGLFGGLSDLMIIADALRSQALLLSIDAKMTALAKKLGARLFSGN